MRPFPRQIAAPLFALLLPFVAAAPPAAALADDAGVAGEKAPGGPREAARAPDDAGDRLSRIEQAMWSRKADAAAPLREWAKGDPNDHVRERSVGALALLRDAEAVPVFLALLNGDPSASVRRAAAEAVGLVAPAVAIGLLTHPLEKDPDPFVRAECARAIGRTGNTQAGPALLLSLVRDPSPDVRALAAESIATLRWAVAGDILRMAARQDNSAVVRIYAVRALREISPRPSASLFRELWDGSSDADLRLEAFRGLLVAEGGAFWVQAGLADADERVRFLAFLQWLSRNKGARPGAGGASDGNLLSALEGFLSDRVRGIRELAKERMEALGARIRPSGFGYAVDR